MGKVKLKLRWWFRQRTVKGWDGGMEDGGWIDVGG